MTNDEGQNRKWNSDARYHISLGYESGLGEDGKPKDDVSRKLSTNFTMIIFIALKARRMNGIGHKGVLVTRSTCLVVQPTSYETTATNSSNE
jgi:hypothetical protein